MKIAVMFGGPSQEHEVSVLTAVQLMKHVDLNKNSLLPIYVDKKGQWWTSDQLTRIETFRSLDLEHPQGLTAFEPFQTEGWCDVALLCFHGQQGESGVIQAILEARRIPYQGPGVTSSAVCFDKIFTRQILSAHHIPQPEYFSLTAFEYEQQPAEIQQHLASLGYPQYLKAANSGSSIGVLKIDSAEEIEQAYQQLRQIDVRFLAEAAVTECIEVNISVLGSRFSELKVSVPEQPLGKDEILSFADKYERGGKKSGMASAQRRIPAPISSRLTEKLQAAAKQIFRVLDCSGVVRIDFFANPSTEQWYVTEVNTIPGSMSYYLWQASGLSYPQLIDELVRIAQEEQLQRQQLISTYSTNILQNAKI